MAQQHACAHGSSYLDRGVDVEAAGEVRGVVGHDRHGVALHAREPRHDVLGEVGHDLWWICVCMYGYAKIHSYYYAQTKPNPPMRYTTHTPHARTPARPYLEEVALVHHLLDHLGHVVGQVGVVRAEVPQALLPPEARVLTCVMRRYDLLSYWLKSCFISLCLHHTRRPHMHTSHPHTHTHLGGHRGRLLPAVERQKVEEVPRRAQRLDVVLERAVRHARHARVRLRAALCVCVCLFLIS